MRTNHLILVITLLSLAVAGCGGSAAADEQSPERAATLDPQEISTEPPAGTLPENPLQLAGTPEATNMTSNPQSVEKFIELARRDLGDRLTIEPDQISLIEAVEITWPNAALGCPSPGKVYASGLVSGYQVKLEVNKIAYDYHMDQNGQFVLCPNYDEDAPLYPTTPGETQSVDPGVPIK